ncbi:hypothetical protein ApDm4_1077 [Acetobacter pomorum]|nr:hypothetical protein ApDm4_1077 [Acetobacter pomorum]
MEKAIQIRVAHSGVPSKSDNMFTSIFAGRQAVSVCYVRNTSCQDVLLACL